MRRTKNFIQMQINGFKLELEEVCHRIQKNNGCPSKRDKDKRNWLRNKIVFLKRELEDVKANDKEFDYDPNFEY